MKTISIRELLPFLFTSLIAICILAIIGVGSYYVTDSISLTTESEANRESTLIGQDIESEIYRIDDLMLNLYYSYIKGRDIRGTAFEEGMVQSVEANQTYLLDASLYNSEGSLLWNSAAGSEADQLTASETEISGQPWFRDSLERIETVNYGSPYTDVAGELTESAMPVSMAVELTNGGQTYTGVLKLDISLTAFRKLIDRYESTSTSYAYLIRKDGTILAHPFLKELQSGALDKEWTQDQINSDLKDEVNSSDATDTRTQISNYSGDKWQITSRVIGYTGWRLVIVNSLTQATSSGKAVFRNMWVIVLLIGAVLIALDLLLLTLVTQPVARLSRAMKSFGNGALDTRTPESGVGEFRDLAHHFNGMAEQTQKLLEQIRSDERQRRLMEKKLLQSQITPHFLYNTLDSIIWMIRGGNREDAEKMVSWLSRFFRVSLSSGRDIITLRKELEHASSYLSIQQMRFKDKFTFTTEVDESLLDYQIPKLVIQPLVENAVYHGMESMYGDGEILIRIRRAQVDSPQASICIEVIDNGEGMSEEQIEHIIHHTVVSGKRGSGIGVKNVDERIKLYFGDAYGVSITSETESGTNVCITIPPRTDLTELEADPEIGGKES